MEITVGESVYPVARLRTWDVCELQDQGVWEHLIRWEEISAVARTRATFAIMAAAVSRAGSKVTAKELLEQSLPEDVLPLIMMIPKVTSRLAVKTKEGETPNAPSPAAEGSTSIDSSGASAQP
jgi:hypothetical protein